MLKSSASLHLIVTGTGRCGTVYMARLISDLGIMCGHESIFNYDVPRSKKNLLGQAPIELSAVSQQDMLTGEKLGDWFDCSSVVADSSYMAAPFLNNPLVENVAVIHIIRNPLKVISSFVLDFGYFGGRKKDRYQRFIYTHLPQLWQYKRPVDAATYFYLKWNEMIDMSCRRRRYLLQRIEDMPSTEFFEFIKRPSPKEIFDDTKINSHIRDKRSDLALHDISDTHLRRVLESFMSIHRYI